ncbi:hypothetical protein T492DRAFT_841292 [Pavlovales sp. CCMP2436]|nr:hypothetical protein T492DRAFT_841292 [Pavlovales sp. CCMP2436]
MNIKPEALNITRLLKSKALKPDPQHATLRFKDSLKVASPPKLLDFNRPKVAVTRNNARFIFDSVWPPDDTCQDTDRAYLTEMFPGPTLKAHLEIDHEPDGATVLDKVTMSAFIEKIGQKFNCEVSAFKSSQGGNRAHVFLDHRMGELQLTDLRGLCTERLKGSIPMLESYLTLDESTSMTRVIRAPFARSPKAHRDDRYTPWIVYTPETNRVCDAKDMSVAIGGWIRKASMLF